MNKFTIKELIGRKLKLINFSFLFFTMIFCTTILLSQDNNTPEKPHTKKNPDSLEKKDEEKKEERKKDGPKKDSANPPNSGINKTKSEDIKDEITIPVTTDPIIEVQKREEKKEPDEFEQIKSIIPLVLIVILFLNQLVLFFQLKNIEPAFNIKLREFDEKFDLKNTELLNKLSNELDTKIKSLSSDKSKEIKEKFDELSNEFETFTQERSPKPSNFEHISAPTFMEPEVAKPTSYNYYKSLESSDGTDSSDKRAFYRIWEQGSQNFFDINPENQSHLFLIERSDSFLVEYFNFKKVSGNRIQNISPGMLEIDGDGKFKITKIGEIQIING